MSFTGSNLPAFSKLTWKGHKFLVDTRDPDIWNKTKERAKGLTIVGIAFMWEIAKAEFKTKLHLQEVLQSSKPGQTFVEPSR